jgi:hypothetical protein
MSLIGYLVRPNILVNLHKQLKANNKSFLKLTETATARQKVAIAKQIKSNDKSIKLIELNYM